MPVTFGLGFFSRVAEMKTLCDAFGYAGRFQALVNPVHTVIAFHSFAGLRVPLGCSPGTSRDTGFAAYAKRVVYKYDAVPGPFLHGAGRTGGNTPRFLAGKLFNVLGPTGIIWVNLGPIGKLFFVLQCDSQLKHPMQRLVSWYI